MDRRNNYLSSEERGVALAEHRRWASQRAIGLVLERAPSAIGRELALGLLGQAEDCPQVARRVHEALRVRCRRPCKLVEGTALYDFVRRKMVRLCWSPEKIAARLRLMHPDGPTARVSHETVLAAIPTRPDNAD